MKLKQQLLLTLCVLLGVIQSNAQCVTLSSVTVNDPQTSTVVLDANGAAQVLPTGVISPTGFVVPDQNGNFIFEVLTSTVVNPDGFLQMVTLAPSLCFTNIVFQNELLVNENEMETTSTSGCGACDGSICYTGTPGFDFQVNGISSSNGCVTGLCSGDYTVSFDPQIGDGGAVYQYYDLDVTVGAFEVGFDVVNNLISPVVNGGSGDYTITINPLLESPIVGPDVIESGCITVSVTDNLTGCSTSFTDHYNFGFDSADIAGGASAQQGGGPDGLVNTADLLFFLGSYGDALGTPGYASQTDFNCDGSLIPQIY